MIANTLSIPDELTARLRESKRDLPALLPLALALRDDRKKTQIQANLALALSEVLGF